MSLIFCPECSAKISSTATACPHCGFVGKDNTLPISVQDNSCVIPKFTYDIDGCDLSMSGLISYEENKELVEYLGNWQNVQRVIPELANVIKDMYHQMFGEDTILVAKIEPYMKKLIEDGVYKLAVDKNGNILPMIRDAKNFVGQVRLQEMQIAPSLGNAISNLQMYACLAEINGKLESMEAVIKDIYKELQDDRFALAESSIEKLIVASKIQDRHLREIAIINGLNSVTDAKHKLMRNFSENCKFVIDMYGKSKSKDKDRLVQKVETAFQDLYWIVCLIKVEWQGYFLLGEYAAGGESLVKFQQFILENKLTESGVLIKLNENLAGRQISFVQTFLEYSNNIVKLDVQEQIRLFLDDQRKFLALAEK